MKQDTEGSSPLPEPACVRTLSAFPSPGQAGPCWLGPLCVLAQSDSAIGSGAGKFVLGRTNSAPEFHRKLISITHDFSWATPKKCPRAGYNNTFTNGATVQTFSCVNGAVSSDALLSCTQWANPKPGPACIQAKQAIFIRVALTETLR